MARLQRTGDHADPDVVGLLYALLRILRQLAS